MLQRKINQQGFTLLEVIVAVGISSMILLAGAHFLSLQSNSVARLKERAEIRSISQTIHRAIQSGYIMKSSAENNTALRNCISPEGICEGYKRRSFVLQNNRAGIVYAGPKTGRNTKYYKLPSLACRSRRVPGSEIKPCRVQAIVNFKARCPLTETGNKEEECQQASDIVVAFALVRESDGKRVYRGKASYAVLSKSAIGLDSDASCPANSVKVTQKRGLADHTDCECKPGFTKTILPLGGIACKASDNTGCPQGDQGSIYHGFEVDEQSRAIQPKCSQILCKTFLSKKYDIKRDLSVENVSDNLESMNVTCPMGSWMSGMWIDKCEAGLCFFKKDGSRCYRDPDKTQLGTPVLCSMKYRCCAKDPVGKQALQQM